MVGADDLAQVRKLPSVLDDLERPVIVQDGNAGAVVAAIFETAEAVEHDWSSVLRADIAHDAAHKVSFGVAPDSVSRPGAPECTREGRAELVAFCGAGKDYMTRDERETRICSLAHQVGICRGLTRLVL